MLLTCACLLSVAVQAQLNYVLNGSFEQYTSCPSDLDQISRAKHWHPIDSVETDPLCAGELCNACSASPDVKIPLSIWYNHYPRSGNSMAMCLGYFDNSVSWDYQRDYLQGSLSQSLINGNVYCVTFYITLAQFSQYSCNKMGLFIDNGSICTGQDSAGCAHVQNTNIPQIYTNEIVDDTLNWIMVQGNYTANGMERFVTLGNFFDASQIDTIRRIVPTHNNISIYLIDDVSVISSDAVANAGPDGFVGNGDTVHIGSTEDGLPCTWYTLGNPAPIGYGGGLNVHPTTTTSYVVQMDLCGHVTYDTMTVYVVPTAVPGTPALHQPVAVYPNPATTQVHIDNAAQNTATITNITGQTILSQTLPTNQETINTATLPPGIYTLTLTNNTTGHRTIQKLQIE